jgi:hypothetical protein
MSDAPAPAAVPKGEVKLPGFGKVSKKGLMVAGVVGGGVLAYAYMRRSKTAAAGTAAADPNLDPVTGYDYGTPQDTAALAAQQGLSTDPGLSGLGLGGGGINPVNPVAPAPAPSATNAQWEQEAIGDLEAGGVAQSTISQAEAGLPRYLAKLELSQAQATAVQMAVGLAGPPPDGGPFSIRVRPDPPPKPAPVPPKPPKDHKTVRADGHSTLFDIARDNHETEAHVVALNPHLAHFVGSKKPIPAGTEVKV